MRCLRIRQRPTPPPLTWSVLSRCLRAPFRRARQLKSDDFPTLWNADPSLRPLKREFAYVLRVYFAPLLSVLRITARVIGVIGYFLIRLWESVVGRHGRH